MILVALVLVLGLSLVSAQTGTKKYVLKFNHVLTTQDPYQAAFLKWADAVSARTNGNLKIEIFPSAQLGVEEDILEQIRQGANVGQNTDAARLGQYVPDIAVMNAPYFVNSLDEVEKLRNLPVVQKWMAELEKTQGFKVLSFMWIQGFRQMITNKPIRKPSDLNGLRIRTPPAPIWQESIHSLGATPVAMAYGDMYSSLQTKALDGVELSFTATYTGKFNEVAKYACETKHILLINFEVVSVKWFNSLPVEYQKILQEECDKAGIEVSHNYLDTIDPKNRSELQAKGMTIIPESDIDMAAFKAAGEKAYQKLNLLAARNEVYKEMGKTK
jgi:tripartite ATP-independent transporter DctP family solute receptor